MQTNGIGVTGQQGQQAPTGNRFNDVGMEEFLKLMIAELQNQDPMNPMSNQEMLEQIGQIREIESNTRLTEALEAVQLGQAMATAGSLIGKTVSGLPDGEEERVTGRVDSVTVVDGEVQLQVAGKSIHLNNVAEIKMEESGGGDQ